MPGEPNTETAFVLRKLGVTAPELCLELPAGSEICLVDHNELGQSIANRSNYQIVAVIDHHKVGAFETDGPLMMRLEPLGSTCSVLATMFQEQGYTPSVVSAKLMISAIISDTLYFRSATTTAQDKEIVQWLNTIAQIADLEAYSLEMFDAKSDISHLQAKEILTMDYKVFDLSGTKVGIGTVETTNPRFSLEKKSDILQAMEECKHEQHLDFILCCVVDILQEVNVALVMDAETAQLIQTVFGATTTDNQANLGPLLSRKKEVVPPLAAHFAS
ncbi:MAG: manganese-dependent inorganic pyrophosphatase [Candidatus Peribacteria bacterium]|nr:MAG: manganese-dependent inorganic pyrophosphatase [Candidatus Peribacteria bacterium]